MSLLEPMHFEIFFWVPLIGSALKWSELGTDDVTTRVEIRVV